MGWKGRQGIECRQNNSIVQVAVEEEEGGRKEGVLRSGELGSQVSDPQRPRTRAQLAMAALKASPRILRQN